MNHQHKEIKVLYLFLKQHKIAKNEDELKKRLLGYEGFPSLGSLVDFFRLEQIPFSIFQFVKTAELPSYFLTYLNTKDGVLLAFVKKKGTHFSVYLGDGKVTCSAAELQELMTDYILVVERESPLQYYVKTWLSGLEEYTFFIVLVSVALYSLTHVKGSALIIALLALMGGITSLIFITKKKGSLIVQSICTSNQVDTCKKIQDIKFLYVLDIAVFALSYFVTLLLFVCFLSTSNVYRDLYLFSILSLSAVVFSVYYQVVKVKSICLLCSIINVTLLALFFYLLQVSGGDVSFNPQFLILLFGVYAILQLVNTKREVKKETLQLSNYLNGFQSNPAIFSFYLENARVLPHSNIDLAEENHITFIVNPDCNSCKALLKAFKQMLMQSTLHIEVKYNLFYDSSDIEYTRASILCKLYQENKASFFRYIEGDETVAPKITKEEQQNIDQLLKNDLDWCRSNQIIGAPALVLNGVLFPIHKYEFNYLRLLIEDYFEEDY